MNERKRCGNLWMTDKEEARLNALIKSASIYRTNKAIRTKADFVRFSSLAIGELLLKKKIYIKPGSTQDEAISQFVSALL